MNQRAGCWTVCSMGITNNLSFLPQRYLNFFLFRNISLNFRSSTLIAPDPRLHQSQYFGNFSTHDEGDFNKITSSWGVILWYASLIDFQIAKIKLFDFLILHQICYAIFRTDFFRCFYGMLRGWVAAMGFQFRNFTLH